MKSIIIGLISICLLSSTYAQQRVDYPHLGFSFEVPAGWEGQEVDDYYVLLNPTFKGLILISAHAAPDVPSLLDQARIGIQDGIGTDLTPISEPERYSTNGIQCILTGTLDSSPAKTFTIGLVSPNSGGVFIMSASTPELFEDVHVNMAKEVAESVVFSKIVKPDPADLWNEMLTNVRLTYITSYSSNTAGGGGYSQKTTIDLCSQGYFNYKDNKVNAFGQYAGAYGQQRGGGTWQLKPGRSAELPILELTFYDGSIKSYELSMDGEKLLLNGYRYFRTYANDTSPEYRPLCD